MSRVEATSPAAELWSERVFGALPLPPVLLGAVLAALLLLILVVAAGLSGELDALRELGDQGWRNRDARLAVLMVLLVSFLPVIRHHYGAATRDNLGALAALSWPPGALEAVQRHVTNPHPRGARWAGAAMLATVPVVALLVDRDPSLYFQDFYWRVSTVWTWSIGTISCWLIGVTTHRVLSDAGAFSRLGASLQVVDLLDREPLAPFARQGLWSALPALLTISFFAINLVDQAFVWAVPAVVPIPLVTGVAGLLLPVRGVRLRLRLEKRAEMARVNAAIRGEPGALLGSPIAGQSDLGLVDLIAWRTQVQSTSVWPFDAPTLVRFALFVALPLGSWLGGALVERLLDAVLRV